MFDNKEVDVTGIGNAVVDIISLESEEFILEHNLNKGSMTLVDEQRSDFLRSVVSQSTETSGGSVANTVVAIADLGGTAAYIGKVKDDPLGQSFIRDVRNSGVIYSVMPASDGPATARCVIVVTPDAKRTMNTYLGVSAYLDPADIDETLVANTKVLYCEGYIWDVPITKQAIRRAIDIAHQANSKVSFTLSDTRCVERHFEEWHGLLDTSIDILFGNEAEICTLAGKNSVDKGSMDEALSYVRERCEIVCVTKGKQGSVVATPDRVLDIPPHEVPEVVDTTGAGDMYAAGFLYGYTSGLDLEICGRLASIVSGEVITHEGARTDKNLIEVAETELGITLEGVSDSVPSSVLGGTLNGSALNGMLATAGNTINSVN